MAYTMYMGIIRILKPGLFLYECVRTILLAFTLVFLLRAMENPNIILWAALAAPTALFPLMALFIWLDIDRYNSFLPLYMAGKCIGIFAFLGWSIIYGRFTIITTGLIFESGNLFALGTALFITMLFKKSKTEDTQCE